jgi:hypothetical protein
MKVLALRFVRWSALGLLLLLVSGPFVPSQQLRAQQTKSGHEFIYYNNAAHSEEVGFTVYCNSGQTFHSGEVTPYYIVIASDC